MTPYAWRCTWTTATLASTPVRSRCAGVGRRLAVPRHGPRGSARGQLRGRRALPLGRLDFRAGAGTAPETRARPTGGPTAPGPRSSFPSASPPASASGARAGRVAASSANGRARAQHAGRYAHQAEAARTPGERGRPAHRRRHGPGVVRLARRRRRPAARGRRPDRSRGALHVRRPCNSEQGGALPLLRLAPDPRRHPGTSSSMSPAELPFGPGRSGFVTARRVRLSGRVATRPLPPVREADRGSGLLPGAFRTFSTTRAGETVGGTFDYRFGVRAAGCHTGCAYCLPAEGGYPFDTGRSPVDPRGGQADRRLQPMPATGRSSTTTSPLPTPTWRRSASTTSCRSRRSGSRSSSAASGSRAAAGPGL